MTRRSGSITPFWRTVGLLLRAAQRRSRGRISRRREIADQTRSGSEDWAGAATLFVFVLLAALHGVLAWSLIQTAKIAMVVDAERDGKLVVDAAFFSEVERDPERALRHSAWDRSFLLGGDVDAQQALLREQLEKLGRDGFVMLEGGKASIGRIARATPLPLTVSTVLLILWFLMLSFQGEGLDFDFQRRHHPMWEWLLSHPIRPGAAFFAEMLAPIAANPSFIACPLFCFVLLMQVHAVEAAAAGAVLIGLPLAVAASCLSKLLEIWAVLRLSERSRGAVLGIASWFGFATYAASFFTIGHAELLHKLVLGLQPISLWRPMLLPWLLGAQADGSFSLPAAVLSAWSACGALIATCVLVSAAATRSGLTSATAGQPSAPLVLRHPKTSRFVRDPLWRKELLWLLRDRGAIVQAFLIPLTFGAYQTWNLSGLTRLVTPDWNFYCSMGVVCGTYFLIVLGPRSLLSEGAALWITHTWPRGLEALFEAKARLWWVLASLPVAALMALTVSWFPSAALGVALVAAGWWIFGQSISRKMVTLVVVTGSDGDPQSAPIGRRFAALLGAFAFGSGVATGNWHLAVVAVVFSTLAAEAMWQDFRLRIPFLFDRWSERPPEAPTLLHAVVAIQGAVEGAALVSLVVAGVFMEKRDMPTAFLIARGVAGLLALLCVAAFLSGRGVSLEQIWRLAAPSDASGRRDAARLLAGGGSAVAGACLLAAAAVLYTRVLHRIPGLDDLLATPASAPELSADLRRSFAFFAVIAAPLSEEVLFRGLLFRALERAWGGWRAVLWSALFFAIYHPPIAWPPVLALGVFNALLFRYARSLTPCVVAHACYNALVIGAG